LEIQYEHEQIVARTEGEAASLRVVSFLKLLGNDLSLEHKLMIFNILEKREAIKTLGDATGVTLFCTPQDLHLNLGCFGNMDYTSDSLLKKVQTLDKVEAINSK